MKNLVKYLGLLTLLLAYVSAAKVTECEGKYTNPNIIELELLTITKC